MIPVDYEWGVWHVRYDEFHVGPYSSKEEAEGWIQGRLDIGALPGAYVLVHRVVGDWEIE